MKEIFGKVNNKMGLTSRTSAELVAEANRALNCKLTLRCNGDYADLKSIMNMMSLVVMDQDEFTIEIEGPEEEVVEQKFIALLTRLRLLK